MSRQLVVPGEFITDEKCRLGDGVFKEKDRVYASVLGLLDKKENFVKVIPLSGRYFPRVNDYVVAMVQEPRSSFWILDMNSGYSAVLNASDYRKELDPYDTDLLEIMPPGEMVYVKIREVAQNWRIFVTMRDREARRLDRGRLVEVDAARIPRVIGRKASMISMIKRETGCNILAGQNGLVWIDGRGARPDIAEKAVEKVGKEAHTSGLTDSIKNMIIEMREKE